MVILKSAAVAGLPLNLRVKVKKVLLVYFERLARLFKLDSARMLKIIHLKTLVEQRRSSCRNCILIIFFCKNKGTKVAGAI